MNFLKLKYISCLLDKQSSTKKRVQSLLFSHFVIITLIINHFSLSSNKESLSQCTQSPTDCIIALIYSSRSIVSYAHPISRTDT